MKSIGLRIKEARLAKNIKQEELAELIGAKSASAVSTWEVGRARPDCITLLRICEVLNISPNYLLGYTSDDSLSLRELALIKKYRYIDDHSKKIIDSVIDIEYEHASETTLKKSKTRKLKIDFYNYPASAGMGNFLENKSPEEIWVQETNESENADFVIPISGDSMEPTFHSGDYVFVSKQDSVEKGEIGIFIINGEVFIKELGNRCLISHNGSYKPIPLRATDSIYCCGRVLGIVEK